MHGRSRCSRPVARPRCGRRHARRRPLGTVPAAVLIAVIAAWALIAIADIFSRAIAKTATETARGGELAAKASANVVLMPTAVRAKRLKGPDEPRFLVAALRSGDNGADVVMLVKEGKPPE